MLFRSRSLRGGESFMSCLWLERKGARFVFHQDIVRENGDMAASGVVTVVVIKDGKLTRGDEMARVLQRYMK